ncbi:GNAT family N-acetyltransferase [Imhoffiella purpurea]|uniref:GNAT family N-acetyltransferase n=1 Tax=Imhoffiella purpurea TaxID=1249627 RepID=UPI0009DEB4B6|nr:GNAT family N-acetyltransferase [Imhoffiella purpurea]
MVIRSAGMADTVSIAATHRASIEGLCSGAYSAQDIGGWIGIIAPDIYENAIKDKVMIVAEDEGEIIGLGILDLKQKEIAAMYIHPKVKGTGVGSRLLLDLEARASKENVERLTLCSTINAHGFYLLHGYIGEDKTFHELPDGVRLECIRMYKLLSTG